MYSKKMVILTGTTDFTTENESLSSEVQKRTKTSSEDETLEVLAAKKAKVTHIVADEQNEKEPELSIEKKDQENNNAEWDSGKGDDCITDVGPPFPSVICHSGAKDEGYPSVPSQIVNTTNSRNFDSSARDDRSQVTEYMRILWENIELFEASSDDISLHKTRSRSNNSIKFCGQVGIRCRHCALLPSESRHRSHAVFPRKLDTIHKHLNNKLRTHFVSSCSLIPAGIGSILNAFKQLLKKRGRSFRSKDLWVQWAKNLGVVETKKGLKFLPPFSSQQKKEKITIDSRLKPTSSADAKLSASSVQLSIGSGAKSHGIDPQQTTTEFSTSERCVSSENILTPKNLDKIVFDEITFHQKMNEYYESLSTSQKELLIGQHHSFEDPSSSEQQHAPELLLPPCDSK
mmetsp:Transcript_33430/g.78849  ORF Transcript_33430/g.78849 Transcript_33430/m.78849 type:complete len:402 (-) Transcript_33430:537-1742(-)